MFSSAAEQLSLACRMCQQQLFLKVVIEKVGLTSVVFLDPFQEMVQMSRRVFVQQDTLVFGRPLEIQRGVVNALIRSKGKCFTNLSDVFAYDEFLQPSQKPNKCHKLICANEIRITFADQLNSDVMSTNVQLTLSKNEMDTLLRQAPQDPTAELQIAQAPRGRTLGST